MKARARILGAVIGLLAASLCAVVAGVAQAAQQHAPRSLTWADIESMGPRQVAALQNPLIAAATPLWITGSTGKWSSLYSTVALDTPQHAVDLYVTNTAKAGGFLAAVKAAYPRINTDLVRVLPTRYSAAQLNSASARLMRASAEGRLPFRIYAVAHPGFSPYLQVEVGDPMADERVATAPIADLGRMSLSEFAGVRLTFARGTPVEPMGREDDSRPFIGGDGLYYSGNGNSCTAGIAVEYPVTHEDLIVTAAHCYPVNYEDITNWAQTHVVGEVSTDDENTDSELIDTLHCCGAGSNADEGEKDKANGGIVYYALPDIVGFADNEIIYQDGFYSFLETGGVRKDYTTGSVSYSISGANGTYDVNGYMARSYAGGPCKDSNSVGCAVTKGDSGGVVFTYRTGSTRNALGMVDAGTGSSDSNGDFTIMYFTTAYWIFKANAVVLNPHT
jgi:hypothetical protein